MTEQEKTGGKIIYSKGGLIYLFRGRNYNYKTRPRFPLMLWKPVTPVYPRLIQKVPEGLTLEEVTEMRKKGSYLASICKLAKNGVYCDLVKNVREAFEACELVRINCQGLNGSDYRKIGAKLKDLVPCVLISFEQEHILIWRGHDWKSSMPGLMDDSASGNEFKANKDTVISPTVEGQALHEPLSSAQSILVVDTTSGSLCTSSSTVSSEDEDLQSSSELSMEKTEDSFPGLDDMPSVASRAASTMQNNENEHPPSDAGSNEDDSEATIISYESKIFDNSAGSETGPESICGDGNLSEDSSPMPQTSADPHGGSDSMNVATDLRSLSSACKEGVLLLWKQAIESGRAVVLDGPSLDADIIYERTVALAKSAPSGPVFRHRIKKLQIQKSEVKEVIDSEDKQSPVVLENEVSGRRSSKRKSSTNDSLKNIKEDYMNFVPQGRLRVDELAKLLS